MLRYSGPLIAAFVAWPLFFSGARSGLGLILISAVALFILEKRLRRTTFALAIVLSLLVFTFDQASFSDVIESGTTIRRIEANKEGSNSIEVRMNAIGKFSLDSYKEGNLLPLIGGGFYVAPMSYGGSRYYYRVDYGIHSIYLFPLEQAGVIGIILFIWFLFVSAKGLLYKIKEQHPTDQDFAKAFLAYFIAALIAGIGGHNFWQGFGSGNFNTFFMISLLIALIPSVDFKTNMATS